MFEIISRITNWSTLSLFHTFPHFSWIVFLPFRVSHSWQVFWVPCRRIVGPWPLHGLRAFVGPRIPMFPSQVLGTSRHSQPWVAQFMESLNSWTEVGLREIGISKDSSYMPQIHDLPDFIWPYLTICPSYLYVNLCIALCIQSVPKVGASPASKMLRCELACRNCSLLGQFAAPINAFGQCWERLHSRHVWHHAFTVCWRPFARRSGSALTISL